MADSRRTQDKGKGKNKGGAPKVKGNLTEVRPGVWKYRRYMGTVDGREQIKSKTFPAASAEEAAMLAVEHARAMMADQADRAAKAETVGGLVDDWWEQQQSTCSPTTIVRERSIVDRIRQRLGPIRLADLNARQVEQFYTWLRTTKFRRAGQDDPQPLSESTVHHHHRVLSAILHAGERWGRVDVVVTRRVQAPKKPKTTVRPPTPGEIHQVITRGWRDPDSMWPVVFAFLAKTGCRRGEACAARWADLRDGVLWVSRSIASVKGDLIEKSTKTDEPRPVELGDDIQLALTEWRKVLERKADEAGGKIAARAYMFPDLARDPRGLRATNPDNVSQMWKRSAEDVGVSARLHDLRHWHATQLLHGGMGVPNVSRRLGHAQTSTTLNIYAHAVDASDQRALLGSALEIKAAEPAVSS